MGEFWSRELYYRAHLSKINSVDSAGIVLVLGISGFQEKHIQVGDSGL